MYDAIHAFADHVAHGVAIGRDGESIPRSRARRIVILGMGGSAIGGDLLRSIVASFPDATVDIRVSRGYEPPAVDRSTLLVASSSSGNTEETLEAFERTRRGAGSILVVTTGGELGKIAGRHGYHTILLPSGLQPRAALAYSFFPLAWVLGVRNHLFGSTVEEAIQTGADECRALLTQLSRRYGRPTGTANKARNMAAALAGRLPVIYSACDRLDVVNLRWRGQIQENAKSLAFGNLLPEMNHNEINGYGHPADLVKRVTAIFLRDREDHPRVAARIDASRRIIRRLGGEILVAESVGEGRLARIFSLIHLGDWVSYWLALINGVDPTPVPVIEGLKTELNRRTGT